LIETTQVGQSFKLTTRIVYKKGWVQRGFIAMNVFVNLLSSKSFVELAVWGPDYEIDCG
jgi:hypothetical protein